MKIFAYNDITKIFANSEVGGFKMTNIKRGIKEKSIKRGEVWYAELPKVGDSIQYGARPVLIISNDYCNKYSSVITVIPLTSVHKKKKQPTHIYIQHTELKGSVAICEQIITISKKRINRKICEVPSNDMNRIERGIKVQIGI